MPRRPGRGGNLGSRFAPVRLIAVQVLCVNSIPLGVIPHVGTSVLILLTLGVIFAASWIMFWVLTQRSTELRQAVALREWCRDRHMQFRKSPDDPLPPPLDAVSTQRLTIRFRLAGSRTSLIQFESFLPSGQAGAEDPPLRPGVWNLLVREVETDWAPTGLRPSAAASSALDLFSLVSYPLLGASERFVVHGTAAAPAAALSRSAARGLLPPDVGMMLHRRKLVLDFSSRPFDAIEFERMIAVADQLVGHLPAPQA